MLLFNSTFLHYSFIQNQYPKSCNRSYRYAKKTFQDILNPNFSNKNEISYLQVTSQWWTQAQMPHHPPIKAQTISFFRRTLRDHHVYRWSIILNTREKDPPIPPLYISEIFPLLVAPYILYRLSLPFLFNLSYPIYM